MLSDESSSDSETGRFKCQTNKQDGQQGRDETRSTNRTRSPGRNKHSVNRYDKGFDRKKDDRDRFHRDRHRHERFSPIRSRYPRDRSRERRSHDRQREKERSKHKDFSLNRDQRRSSRSRFSRSPMHNRNVKDEIKNIIVSDKTTDKYDRKPRDDSPPSPIHNVKRSEVYKPQEQPKTRKSESPVVIDHDSPDEEVQLGSYYSMIPAVVKEKSEESSEIDSSDDEKLRAKLLNLEKELNKSKKKKHKKKHKKRSSKSKDKVLDATSVEVTSTTDIQEVQNEHKTQSTEVSSTQKNNRKDSSEEGEILSEEEEFDSNDLRHKLKRSKTTQEQPKLDACGPALPPHLQKRYTKSVSPDNVSIKLSAEMVRNIGPTIPSDMRKVLAEQSPELIKESSDEDGIGPLPAGAEEKWSEAHQKLEERAYEMKIQKLEGQSMKSKDVNREQWMLELPEGKTKFLGLEARGFRAKAGPDMSDRSSWTDTPEDKARKASGVVEEDPSETLQREAKDRQVSNRDEEQEQAVRRHKKKHKRDESLLEMHQKKLKKKKKKEIEDKKERRPFSRDVDLQVNKFDEAQKKSIIKKAQDLNTRFSRGDAKFL
ncbi:zinc finger CCCH domain-containing protein 13 [Pieris brassicae]|uniref:DUF3752 domain-containing protein n=1 Tax=Pieris brassicae TaxID=7116 RepID=A0A9P0T5I2_PIEBR|nr:zinc finger CCCH domain-containing protein 13 [Pieris brassicae]XP_045512068.1 zinc finger CCCH domain-containing protein 13 [Pieris brassicae]CAH4017811.1 unnamed protein product [Pieris brassicae]